NVAPAFFALHSETSFFFANLQHTSQVPLTRDSDLPRTNAGLARIERDRRVVPWLENRLALTRTRDHALAHLMMRRRRQREISPTSAAFFVNVAGHGGRGTCFAITVRVQLERIRTGRAFSHVRSGSEPWRFTHSNGRVRTGMWVSQINRFVEE